MNNITLGRTLKAMYKLGGKTMTQLSDETGLTVDTINNLFYARIQKPGLAGVNSLVVAMGFNIQQLMTFLEKNPELTDDCDVTELFTQTVAAEDAVTIVEPAKETVTDTKASADGEIERLNAEYEKQFDRFRATYQRHEEQLQEQHNLQIEQMRAHNEQMKQHFDGSVEALKSIHAREMDRLESDIFRMRRENRWICIALCVETILVLLALILDMLNHNIGWMR